MRLSDHAKGRAGDWTGRFGPRGTAQIIRLDDYRPNRRPQAPWRRAVVQPPEPAPRLRRRVPIEVWVILLVLISAAAGALFALMGLGYLP